MRRMAAKHFQFHYGTIKRTGKEYDMVRYFYFQFHYGTIKSAFRVEHKNLVPCFQFHYGTIKSPTLRCSVDTVHAFNSTMVRLKVGRAASARRAYSFQFHYGTIKREYRRPFPLVPWNFQFHYGTIKRKPGKVAKAA